LSSITAILSSSLLQNPLFLLGLFIGGSLLMIWRLELMTQRGVEGTVLGTLVMPYCSGIGNLIFAVVAFRSQHLDNTVVAENALVNNVTNMTLLIGLPAILWGVTSRRSRPNRKRKEVTKQRLNRLSIFLTLTAVLFFTGITWALGKKDGFDSNDGYVLVGLFLFWQCFHVYDVLKTNVRERRSLSWLLALDFLLLLLGGFDVYYSVDGLVAWIEQVEQSALKAQAGWLSGWLMVLPNALLALYYGWRRKPEVIYTSQIGDGHICIPLCIGIAAILSPSGVGVPEMFNAAILLLGVAVVIHYVVVGYFGQLPRFAGIILTLMYIGFVVKGFGGG
jgi:cation:H+ antiporter